MSTCRRCVTTLEQVTDEGINARLRLSLQSPVTRGHLLVGQTDSRHKTRCDREEDL